MPDAQKLYYFKKGLRPDLLPFLLMHNPQNLNTILELARTHEQGTDFATDADPISTQGPKNYEKDIEQLTKQMQQLSLNYATIASVLTAQTEKPQFKQNSSYHGNTNKKNNNFSCFRCGEPGHYAKNCLAERLPTTGQQYPPSNQNQNKQNRNINFVEAEYEDEVYVTRHQPYSTNRKEQKEKQKQSESAKEHALRSKTPQISTKIEQIPIEVEQHIPPVKKILKKRLPSKVDQLNPYDISEDLLETPAHITYGQLLQYPNQWRNLAKALRRKKAPSTKANHLQTNNSHKTVAMRCHVRIKGNPVVAILDSGAAVSIITKKLMDKIGLEIDQPSRTVVVTANGNRTKALGIVTNVKITIQDLIIPIRLQVIESQEETLLLGTDWFSK